ncbi:DUF58 domain-containing protein [Patulibacter sp.]|uniref:DUF58 domain-containing protein n=1 Tax=Patulibacter sp. TaxID=1912859 RepID=UPI002716053F|nr:DUF58 domain-containing protein [Patulibacter sp.]MDO9409404.1 DUF58 domain-containing protein [Patulibacter sp.]
MRRRFALVAFPLVCGFGGAALGSLALFGLALGVLVLYVASGIAVAVGARRLRVDRTIDRHEVLENRPVALRYAVAGLRGLPVHVEVLGADGGWWVLGPGGGSTSLVIDRPGPHVLDATRLRVRDDLGLFSRPARAGRPASVLVLPQPAPTPEGARRGGADPVGDPEPDGLRSYVPGTSMSRIHWASAARGGELQERAFVTARDRLPLVVVDTAGTEEDEDVHWAMRTAAGHVQALLRTGGCRVLLPGDRTPSTVSDPVGHWPAVHRRLAALEADTPARVPAGDDHGALHVRAALAPDGGTPEGPLPHGVVPLEVWEAAA